MKTVLTFNLMMGKNRLDINLGGDRHGGGHLSQLCRGVYCSHKTCKKIKQTRAITK